MNGDLLIVHGGAPTPVSNSMLYGVLRRARELPGAGRVFGARGGTGGILNEDFIDLSACPALQTERLPDTPGFAAGTSRFPLEQEDYANIVKILKKRNIGRVIVCGGNGTMGVCGGIQSAPGGADIAVVGAPQTIDNDVAVTDHVPGYGSAARYLAATVAEIAQDVRSLPIHVCIVEAMGRNAGWITAASALAWDSGAGPDCVYIPEAAFDEDAFLARMEELHRRQGGVVAVVSEGIRDGAGKPVAPVVFESGRSVYYGDVSATLAALVIKRLGIKARSEKPGICGRASIAHQSPTDRAEAIRLGECAVDALLAGQTGVMLGWERISDEPYAVRPVPIPVEQVMLHERKLPKEFWPDTGDAFTNWCRPLIGAPIAPFADIG